MGKPNSPSTALRPKSGSLTPSLKKSMGEEVISLVTTPPPYNTLLCGTKKCFVIFTFYDDLNQLNTQVHEWKHFLFDGALD